MRTLTKIMLATVLALSVSSSASALVNITLTQIGGTFAGGVATPSDSLVLQIDYTITGGTMVTAIAIALDVGGVATLGAGSTETAAALWEFGATSAAPIGAPGTDITTLAPGQITGWEKVALAAWGTPTSCIYDATPGGSCGTLGVVVLHLTGAAGVIDTGSILAPTAGATVIGDATFQDITAAQNLGTFTIIPEPTTASLLGLGLLGLTVAGRQRKN